MKTCTSCQESKDHSEFWKQAKSSDGYQPWCKTCSTARRIRYYKDNKEREVELRDQWNAQYREWYISLKQNKPCADCGGIFHPAAMQWHHLPGHQKVANLAQMATARRAKSVILAEIAKCVLICANCHAVRTWRCSSVG